MRDIFESVCFKRSLFIFYIVWSEMWYILDIIVFSEGGYILEEDKIDCFMCLCVFCFILSFFEMSEILGCEVDGEWNVSN